MKEGYYVGHEDAQQALGRPHGDTTSISWAYDNIAGTANIDDHEAADRVVWQPSQVPDAGLQQLMKEASTTRQRMYNRQDLVNV